jgi:hypothetical protein
MRAMCAYLSLQSRRLGVSNGCRTSIFINMRCISMHAKDRVAVACWGRGHVARMLACPAGTDLGVPPGVVVTTSADQPSVPYAAAPNTAAPAASARPGRQGSA